jgi:type II secretory pathway pseudopilin PulG
MKIITGARGFSKDEPLKIDRRQLKRFIPRVQSRFSLVELLVVISILAVLMSLLTPSLNKMAFQAGLIGCKNNLKNIHLGLTLYVDDYNEFYPEFEGPRKYTNGIGASNWDDKRGYIIPLMEPYFGGSLNNTFMCLGSEEHSFWKSTRESYNDNKVLDSSAPCDDWDRCRIGKGIGKAPQVPYQLYFNADFSPTKMVRVGDSFEVNASKRNGSEKNPNEYVSFNILASDMSYWDVNLLGTNHIRSSNYKDEKLDYASGGPYFSTPMVNNNYLFEDGSTRLFEYDLLLPYSAMSTALKDDFCNNEFVRPSNTTYDNGFIIPRIYKTK